MGKAVDCSLCRTGIHLQWKTYGGDEWWITCDNCGNHGPAKPTQSQAGEAWNEQEKPKEES